MRSLVFGIAAAASLLGGGASLAQTTTTGTPPAASATSPPPSGANGAAADRDKNAGAAAGNTNQAVATTDANAPGPAKGANSFTMGEAKSRLEKNGFSNVGDLTKDDNGVWRGNAQKGGSTTAVWLDYKGNVGEGK
jgi:protein CpxP